MCLTVIKFVIINLYILKFILYRVSQRLIQEESEAMSLNNNYKGDREKGVLEKLIDIDKRIAVILARDTLFGGVDTVSKRIIKNNTS